MARKIPDLIYCPNCGEQVKKLCPWCVSCGVDFGATLYALEDARREADEDNPLRDAAQNLLWDAKRED